MVERHEDSNTVLVAMQLLWKTVAVEYLATFLVHGQLTPMAVVFLMAGILVGIAYISDQKHNCRLKFVLLCIYNLAFSSQVLIGICL